MASDSPSTNGMSTEVSPTEEMSLEYEARVLFQDLSLKICEISERGEMTPSLIAVIRDFSQVHLPAKKPAPVAANRALLAFPMEPRIVLFPMIEKVHQIIVVYALTTDDHYLGFYVPRREAIQFKETVDHKVLSPKAGPGEPTDNIDGIKAQIESNIYVAIKSNYRHGGDEMYYEEGQRVTVCVWKDGFSMCGYGYNHSTLECGMVWITPRNFKKYI